MARGVLGAARDLGIPTVFTVHNIWPEEPDNPAYLPEGADQLVFISNYVKDEYARCGAPVDDAVLIPGGVDCACFQQRPAGRGAGRPLGYPLLPPGSRRDSSRAPRTPCAPSLRCCGRIPTWTRHSRCAPRDPRPENQAEGRRLQALAAELGLWRHCRRSVLSSPPGTEARRKRCEPHTADWPTPCS